MSFAFRSLAVWFVAAAAMSTGPLPVGAEPAGSAGARQTPASDVLRARRPVAVPSFDERLARLLRWRGAVDRRTGVGTPLDGPDLSDWTRDDIRGVVADLGQLVAWMAAQRENPARALARLPTDGRLAHGLTLRTLDEANALLKRGALAHATVAILAADRPAESPRRFASDEGVVVIIRDGQQVGISASQIHWEAGRALIAGLQPAPAAVPGVREWYARRRRISTTTTSSAISTPTSTKPSASSPTTPTCTCREARSTRRMPRPACRARGPRPWCRADAGRSCARGATISNRPTATFAARSISTRPWPKPGFASAASAPTWGDTTRRSRCSKRPSRLSTTRRFAFLRALRRGLLRRARRPRRRPARIRACGIAFPAAQSPLLGLASLQWQTGQRHEAMASLRRLVALPRDETARDDPWWLYTASHVRAVVDDLEAMREAMLAAAPAAR